LGGVQGAGSVQWVRVGVCACVEEQRGSPGPHARLAVARSPGKMTPRRPPASPPRCDRSWGEEEEAASSPIAGQLLMRLPAADSVQNQAGLWRERERERREEEGKKSRAPYGSC